MKTRILILMSLTSALLTSSMTAQEKFRVEKDLLGQKEIPANAYYGVQTARALENFQISDIAIDREVWPPSKRLLRQCSKASITTSFSWTGIRAELARPPT
jgi:hypothetical protein